MFHNPSQLPPKDFPVMLSFRCFVYLCHFLESHTVLCIFCNGTVPLFNYEAFNSIFFINSTY